MIEVAKTAARAMAMPSFFRPMPNLVAAIFPLMKLLPALSLVEAAPKGQPIIETSSGTMGLALASVCANRNIDLTLVTPKLEAELRIHLQALGQTRIIEVKGDQSARLEVLDSLLERAPQQHWTRQYDSPLVAASYAPVGVALGELSVDVVVAAVGSGGSGCGIASAVRSYGRDCEFVAVDAQHSVLFGHADGPRNVPGIGNSIMPGALKHEMVDQVCWVSDRLMIEAARYFAREAGIFIGPTGAACLLVAMIMAKSQPSRTIGCIVADQGHRYLRSVFAASDANTALNMITHTKITTALATGRLNELDIDCATEDWGRRSFHQRSDCQISS